MSNSPRFIETDQGTVDINRVTVYRWEGEDDKLHLYGADGRCMLALEQHAAVQFEQTVEQMCIVHRPDNELQAIMDAAPDLLDLARETVGTYYFTTLYPDADPSEVATEWDDMLYDARLDEDDTPLLVAKARDILRDVEKPF